MQKNAMIGGVLSIISGAFGILGAFGCAVAIIMFTFLDIDGAQMPGEVVTMSDGMYSIFGIFSLLIGVLAIVGGNQYKKKELASGINRKHRRTLTSARAEFPLFHFHCNGKAEFNMKKRNSSVDS
jgi:hypothetical protein